uniref:Uncharacterized protein n=1 Tax=Triticum aestivum TaxID=4565 RepID=A0A182BG21_WHEAT|nr:hypothetical protein AEX81_00027 [Triticum aestivum]
MAKTRQEAINMFLEQVASAEKLRPETDPEIVFFKRYCIALYWRPDGMLPCHVCQEDNPRNTPMYIDETNMKSHCKLQHRKATIKCTEQKCTVLFNSLADKELHEFYCHKKAYGNNNAFHVIGSSGH